MKIINLKEENIYLEDYVRLCSLEWGIPKNDDEVKEKVSKMVSLSFEKSKSFGADIFGAFDIANKLKVFQHYKPYSGYRFHLVY